MGIREDIIWAGRNLRKIWIRAREVDGSIEERDVEPYSFRNSGRNELFFGFDPDRGIRSFRMNRIIRVNILGQSFIPRWPVEF